MRLESLGLLARCYEVMGGTSKQIHTWKQILSLIDLDGRAARHYTI